MKAKVSTTGITAKTIELEKCRWIFFDIGGVILDDSAPETARQAKLLYVAKKYLPETSQKDVYYAWLRASKKPGSVRLNALEFLLGKHPKYDKAKDKYLKLCEQIPYLDMSHIRPEASTVISRLSTRYHLGLAGNQSIKVMALLKKAKLLSFLQHQKVSGHLGKEKPDPGFFIQILKEVHAKPNECILVDDNWYRGLAPAKKLGMFTILLQRDFIPYPKTAKPTVMIRQLKNLLTLLL